MTVNILVPPLSQTMDTLTFVCWLKNEGDKVGKGEPLFSVETDKATLEVESPASGILRSCKALPGDEIYISSVIGEIDDEISVSSKGSTRRFFASPRARNIARQRGIDVTTVKGSGPYGAVVAKNVLDVSTNVTEPAAKQSQVKTTPLARRIADVEGINLDFIKPEKPGQITKEDVRSALARQNQDKPVNELVQPGQKTTEDNAPISKRLTRFRQTISTRLQKGHLEGVAVTYGLEVDVTRLVNLRKRVLSFISEESVRPTITDFLILFICKTLVVHPEFNATFDGNQYEIFPQVNISLAIDTPQGLYAPVIHHAQEMRLSAIATRRRELIEKAMNNTLSLEESSGGTFTFSNLGSLGIDFFTPVLNPYQVAILGTGRIQRKLVLVKRKTKKRELINLALTCDHRVIDGAPAARFLHTLCSFLENPDLFFL
jgi:pyruvate dehydrogenase E2 component (dihydrolipoamide acetyltransferase)